MQCIHLHHVTAVTMDEHMSVIHDAAIVISKERITYIGPQTASPEPAPSDDVFDFTGHVAMPGLVNAHTHLAMTLFRGAADDLPLMTWLQEKIWPIESQLTYHDVYWASLLGMAESIRAGVTTFNDMYWHVDAVAAAVRESRIRACLAGVVIGVAPDGEEQLEKATQHIAELKSENNPLITPFFGPHAPYTVPISMLEKIIARADKLGVGIHTHLSETQGEVKQCQTDHGLTPIALMDKIGLFSVPVTAAHCVHPTRDEIDILAQRGVGIVHCPSSNMKLGSGIAPLPQFLAAGATVGLGTDGAGSNNTLSLFREMHLAALLHKVQGDPTAIKAGQALWMATRGSAAALGLTEVGSLEVGKLADIIVLNFNKPHLLPVYREISNLVYAAYGSDVDSVFVHGRMLMYHNQLTTIDEEQIAIKVNQSVQRLFRL